MSQYGMSSWTWKLDRIGKLTSIGSGTVISSQVSPSPSESRTVLVPISRNHYQSDESIRHYREYFSVNPTSFELWNNLGLLSHQKHKKLASIACFRRAVYLNPIDSVAWLNLALLYLHNGQLISALNAINSTLALSRDSMAFDVFGLVLMLLGQERVQRQTLFVIENVRETLQIGPKCQKSIFKSFETEENRTKNWQK